MSDLIVVWGGDPVNAQVNVMTPDRARKGAARKLVVVDLYMNGTMEEADMPIPLRPGTDGALACAVMHVLSATGSPIAPTWRHADCPEALEAHLATRGPEWAAAISGLPVAEIEAFAKLSADRRAYIRVGYGFSRMRNGAANLHAVTCLPTVTGKWMHGAAARSEQSRHLPAGQVADRGPRRDRSARGCWINRGSGGC